MNTDPEFSERKHQAYQPQTYQIQCPRCGTYSPMLNISYLHPQTGKRKSTGGWNGVLIRCFFWIIAYIAVGLITDLLIVYPSMYFTGTLSNPLYGDVGFFTCPVAIVGALFYLRSSVMENK